MDMNQQQLEEAAREAAKEMYRLDCIAYVSHNVTTEDPRCVISMRWQQQMHLDPRIEPFMETAGLLPLARLNESFFKLDEPLVSAFVEHWRPETHSFMGGVYHHSTGRGLPAWPSCRRGASQRLPI
ncbi:hypothetical protein PIB30_003043 [Stylosanthes scabra]|uniref:Aminotransferase-like plant mobile domain-containing protein n=1 Tax=Stylosanthes scabra TaxID=79078 RepID=A0ABU6X420_9FABA|nr:hypothetical protein [Stylosanthes scabra]